MRSKIALSLLLIVITALPLINVAADNDKCPARDRPPEIKSVTWSYVTSRRIIFKAELHDPDNDHRFTWEWDFGDGEVKVIRDHPGTSIEIEHVYKSYGVFFVKVRAKSWKEYSKWYTVTVPVKRDNYPPVAQILSAEPNPTIPGKPVTFEGKGMDSDGNVVEMIWDFGDGKKESVKGAYSKVTHSYSKPGEYKVVLRVKDNKGELSPPISLTIFVSSPPPPPPKNRPPVIEKVEYSPTKIEVGQEVEFRATAYDPEGKQITFYWDLGDGTSKKGSPLVKHSYSKSGTYVIKVYVTDPEGAKSNVYKFSIAVRGNEPPKASIVSFLLERGNRLLVIGSGSDPDGQVVYYQWDFGDGTSQDGRLEGNLIPHKRIEHVYEKSGVYTVKFRVKDEDGAWSSWVVRKVNVTVPTSASSVMGMGNEALIVGGIIVGSTALLAYRESRKGPEGLAERAELMYQLERRRRVTKPKPAKVKRRKVREGSVRRKRNPWDFNDY